ncbi:MAG TPA: MFS transporter [Usitatibacter sp.]|nr:MFS transporter [Usitatibacter sp.]
MTPRALRRTLFAAAFLRALAIGLMAVLIGLYTARLGFNATQIGAVLSSALWGAALAALLTLLLGPRFTQRSLLVTLSALPALGAVVLISAEAFSIVLAAAFVGMFNVHGRDRGAIPILEQALLPLTATDADRTKTFAWYNVLLDAGYAGGGLLAALPTLFEETLGLDTITAMRWAIALFCVLYGAAAILYARLPAAIPRAESVSLARLSPESRPIVWKISALFFVDAFGGGFIGSALFAYFFAEQFGVSAAHVAILFAAGRVLSALSHFAAAWLAGRIGLVNTLVYTHIPSSILLFTIVATDTFWVAALLFLLREGLNEMDVPTRQSYTMAVVRPEERMAVAGATSLVRSTGWAAAPVFAGMLMTAGGLGLPLVFAGVTKIAYDLMLWREFRKLKPPEET